jgi:hypothetical protein
MSTLSPLARLVAGLEVFLALGALGGGGLLVAAPDGHLLGLPLALLGGTPFGSFLVPGLLLFAVLGVGPAVAAGLTLTARPGAALATVAVGVALVVWIATEMVFLAGAGSLAWTLYLVLGTVLAMLGGWLRLRPEP